MSMCTQTGNDRFTTTTVADSDQIRVEPSASSPTISGATAYARYVRQYHQPTRAEAPTMQVRYGVLTDGQMGQMDADGPVPLFRRTHAWVISLCDSPQPPWAQMAGDSRHRLPSPPADGLVVVEIGDEPGAPVLNGYYLAGKSSFSVGGMGVSPDNPAAAATPYVSVPWHLADRRGDRVLLRYRPMRCYTLDHVNVGGDRGDIVSVVLSGGPGHTCPAPSAIQPYVEVTLTARSPEHGAVGPQRFEGRHS